MGFDLICTVCFLMILLLLVYTQKPKLHVINDITKEKFAVTGDYDDYIIADINTPGGAEVAVDCDFFERMPKKITGPGNLLRAVSGMSVSDSFVYDDYSMTPKEVEYTTGVQIPRNDRFANKGHGTLRVYSHDSKDLEANTQ